MPPKSRDSLITQLEDLLDAEHCYACESEGANTCDIVAAFQNGLPLWAGNLFIGSGGASKKFERLYARINPTDQELDEECRRLLKTSHIDCPACGAIVWDPLSHSRCSNCRSNVDFVETLWGLFSRVDGELYE